MFTLSAIAPSQTTRMPDNSLHRNQRSWNNNVLAASKTGCCQAREALPLKRSREGLDRERRQLIHDECVHLMRSDATPRIFTAMNRVLSALVMSGGIALITGDPRSVLA